MTNSNPFAPPKAPVLGPRIVQAWFKRRPIPVFIVSAFCILQYVGVVSFLRANWHNYAVLIDRGAISPIELFFKLLYPTLLFMAGVCLLFLWRRSAAVLFASYFAWGVARIIATPTEFASYLSLGLAFGFLVYALRLAAHASERKPLGVRPETAGAQTPL